jgi:hypothetical protein
MPRMSDDEFNAAWVRIAGPASPATLFDEVAEFIGTYVIVPVNGLHAMTLWAAHCHLLDAFDSTPRLAFLSVEPGCGKTRAQEVLETLVPNPLRTSTVTTAVLFRLIDSGARPVVFIDEVDSIWPTNKGNRNNQNEELRALVNSGHRRGNGAARMIGEGTKMRAHTFATFAPVCLSGLGTLPGTVADRSIQLLMKRRRRDEPVSPWRFRSCEPEGHRLRDLLAEWAADRADQVADLRPTAVEGVSDRAWESWEPLLQVADAVGGEWPELARIACLSLTANEPGPVTAGLRLLTDLRTVWPVGKSFVATADLLARLYRLEDAPWGTEPALSSKRLASLLRRYDVASRRTASERGYELADLLDPWERYLPLTDTLLGKQHLPSQPVIGDVK